MSARIADEKKGRDIAIREVTGVVGYADYFVLVTGASRRQVQAIADDLEAACAEKGESVRREGYPSGWWILLDFGAVIVHLFQPDARTYYDLDHLWADAPEVATAAKPLIRDARAAQ